jgi:hypothetical protein
VPSDRCAFGQATFTGTDGNGRDAPFSAIRRALAEGVKSTHSGHSVSHASGLEVGLGHACPVTLIVVECRPKWNLEKVLGQSVSPSIIVRPLA